MNMQQMMKQAQEMKRKMEELQSKLEATNYEGAAGGGAVKIVVNGRKEVQDIKISPDVVSAEDIEILQDLIMAAFRNALTKAEEDADAQMNASGLGAMGGMF